MFHKNHVNGIKSTNVNFLSLAHFNKSASSKGKVMKISFTKKFEN